MWRLTMASAIRLSMAGYPEYDFSVIKMTRGIDKPKRNTDICTTTKQNKKQTKQKAL